MQLHKHRQHESHAKRGQALLETDRVLNKAKELTRNIGSYKRFVQETTLGVAQVRVSSLHQHQGSLNLIRLEMKS
jgi:hypothetical protein